MKKLALILVMGTLVFLLCRCRAQTLFWFERGSHTVRQAANLSVMMVLLVHRKNMH